MLGLREDSRSNQTRDVGSAAVTFFQRPQNRRRAAAARVDRAYFDPDATKTNYAFKHYDI